MIRKEFYIEYFNGEKWVPSDGPFVSETIAWISLGKDNLNYRVIDGHGNVLTDNSKPRFENKFIVININRLEELDKKGINGYCFSKNLREAIYAFDKGYNDIIGKPMDQKYYVCNQDEPYAQEVLDLILLDGQKGRKNE